ncbi:MAG: MBL fold metallo-hydrolase [Lachnospiraceae bacterium]|nr:MBL fold metallo-hydrolase [Lachnospiraceae bacterium]
MKKGIKAVLIGAGAAALAAGAFFGARAVTFGAADNGAEAAQSVSDSAGPSSATLAEFSDYEIFADVPRMSAPDARYEYAVDDGAGTYGISVYETTKADYDAYLSELEADGYVKFADNGEGGLGGYIYKTFFTKGDLRLSVTYIYLAGRTMISACEGGAWSEHLNYDVSYVAANVQSAQTKLYLPELFTTGASFFLQLKNGHFIINDGGTENELPYLLDDLEALVPEGEKPVIEAWFMSHPHTDHMGVFKAFLNNKDQMDRVYVENMYFNMLGEEAAKYYDRMGEDYTVLSNYVRGLPKMLSKQDGGAPELYEMAIGDRYYFNDFSVEVIYSSEVQPYEDLHGVNGSCTWLLYNIEGQKILFPGDGLFSSQKFIMNTYDRAYFDLDIYFPSHHGYDTYDQFTYYLKRLDTVLYPNYHKLLGGESGYSNHTEQLKYINERARESYTYGEGTVVLTFPYKVGSAEIMEPREWKYNSQKPPR